MSILRDKFQGLPVQARASCCFLICAFLQKGISMITTPIFTRLLSTAEYGQYNVFNSWLGIVSIFVSLSLAGGVYTQGLVKFENDRNVFSSSIQGLTLTLFLVWTFVYFAFRTFWNKLFGLTTVQVLLMLVMIWTTAVFSLWANDQRVDYKYKSLVVITLIVSLLKPITGIVAVIYSDDKVTARILSLALIEIIGYSWLSIVQFIKGRKFYSRKYWNYALKFNLPLIPHYLSQIVLNSADRIMIGKMVGDSEAGIYSLAYSLSLIMTLFNTALINTLNPWIYRKIREKKVKDISNIAYLSLIIIAVVNLCLIILAPEAVAIFAPITYRDAIWVIPPVAISVYFMFAYDLFAKFAFFYEKTKLIMVASISGALLNVLLNYWLIKIYGYIAAAYTTLICYIVYSLAHYMLMNKICKKYCDNTQPYDTRIVLLISVLFLTVGLSLSLTYHYTVLRYFVIVIIVTAILIFRKKIYDNIKFMLSK